MTPTPQLSKSGVAYRRAMGIPLTAPKVGRDGRGGNYQITEDQAREIWADIQMLVTNCRYREFDICRVVADQHGVGKYLVQNIRNGRSWNSITGLDVKRYD
jgi:hypothetical protein